MRSTLPYDPRASQSPEASTLGQVGRAVIAYGRRWQSLAATLGGAALSLSTPGKAARTVVRRVLLSQIFYTGVQALGLVSSIGVLLGATIVIQTELMVPSADSALIGKVLVAVVLRELAPLTTAVIVAGRSGTAMATELGNMKVSSEILALSSLGIDPPRFIVMPRLAAAAISVVVLMVYFAGVAIAGTIGVGTVLASVSFDALKSGVAAALTPYDLALFLVKGVGLGSIVGWLCCHYGLQVRSSPTEVPRMASRGVVMSLLGCVAFNTFATAVFYWTVGPSLR